MNRTARSKAFYLFLPLRNTLANPNRYVVYKEMTWKWPVKWPLPSSHLTTNPLMNDISLTRCRFDVQQLVSKIDFFHLFEKNQRREKPRNKTKNPIPIAICSDRGCSIIACIIANSCRLVIRVAHAK
jgi:hypothetical protein